jgi:hypothetical protein
MNVIYKMVGILPMMAFAIAAQDSIDTTVVPLRGAVDNEAAQMKRELRQVISQATVVGVRSAVMGPAVKGAPYSAVEVAANTQTLFDGTHIDRKTETRVYRDSEGRIRRETADEVNIWDPVAGVSYILDPKNQTAHQMVVHSYVGPEIGASGVRVAGDVNFAYVANGPVAASGPLPPPPQSEFFFQGKPATMVMTKGVQKLAGKSESLGNQTIEGVNVTGTRMTSTIEAGAIGNDRPIEIVSESWYSAELQAMVKSTHSDPRTGQETLDLMNISRTEPSADLFQVPAGYQIVNRK